MNMNNYTITKTATATKIRTLAKADISNMFIEFLSEKLGEENVAMVRIGSTPSNEIAFKCGVVTEEDGSEFDLCCCINPVVKKWADTTTSKGKVIEGFDFEQSKEDYDNYLIEVENKKSEKARLKEEKIKRDNKAREEKKKTTKEE